MADLNEIYQEINDEVTSDLTINATSTSKVSEFRLWEYIVAQTSLLLQGLWEIKKTELQQAADAVPTCNDSWWDAELRKFQYGDELLLDNVTKKYYYEITDTTKQIVNSVAISNQQIKVAKAGPAPLTDDERAALDSFVRKVQPLGTNIILISQDADVIHLDVEIFYDAIVPLNDVQTAVESAINTYLTSLDFSVGRTGTFYITFLVDALQAVNGVVDVKVNNVLAGQTGATELSTVSRKYSPVAGYLVVDPDNPLATSLTYTPEQ